MKRIIFVILFMMIILLSGCNRTYSMYTFKNSDAYKPFDENISISDTVNTLNVSWVSGYLEIKEGETFSVSEEKIRGEYMPLYWMIDGDTLNIRFAQNNSNVNNRSKKLVIVLPKDSITNIDIDVISANYSLKLSSVNKLIVDNVSGRGIVEVDTIKTIDIDTVSGDTSLSIYSTVNLSSINIDSVSGDAEIGIGDNGNYNLDFDTVSGNIKIKKIEKSIGRCSF